MPINPSKLDRYTLAENLVRARTRLSEAAASLEGAARCFLAPDMMRRDLTSADVCDAFQRVARASALMSEASADMSAAYDLACEVDAPTEERPS